MNRRVFVGVIAVLASVTGLAAEEPSSRYPFAKGTIEKVEVSLKKIIVATPDGSQAFTWTARAYVYRGKEKMSFEKLKVGDMVKMNYYTNETGQAFIRRMKVDAP